VPNTYSTLTPTHFTDPKPLNFCHCQVLIFDKGLPFPTNYLIATKLDHVLFLLANDQIRSLSTSMRGCSLAANANSNQLPQDNSKISQPSQPGCDFHPYAPLQFFMDYAMFTFIPLPYALPIIFLPMGSDEVSLIPIMLCKHRHFIYQISLSINRQTQLLTVLGTNLPSKIYLNFCWSTCA